MNEVYNRMKKFAIIILLVCITVLLLNGCTEKPKDETSSSAIPTIESTSVAATTQEAETELPVATTQPVIVSEQETEIVPDTTPTTTTKHMIPEPTQAQQIETENTGMEIVGDVTVEIGPGAAVGGD